MIPPAIRPAIRLAALDLAGTTIADDGAVEAAFVDAVAAVGVAPDSPRLPAMLAYVRETMGHSKIAVFRHLFDGDESVAQRANLAFERAYGRQVTAGKVTAIPGAEQAITALRQAGILVALTTGFAPVTRRAILEAVGWTALADLTLSPADAGRGRPYPDMILTAVLRLGIDDVAQVAVAGDTASDVTAGLRAGASIVAGVLTGAHGAEVLRASGATHVLGSVAELPSLLIA